MPPNVSQVAQEGADRPPVPAPPEARRTLGRVLALLLTAAAVAAAVYFGATTGRGGGRTVDRVVDLQARGPDQPAPQPGAGLAGLRMPDLAAQGWRPQGARVDDVAGRTVATLFADRAGRVVAVSVVSGQPQVPPRGAARLARDGVVLFQVRRGDREALVWRRAGRTTVLSGEGVPAPDLADLAVRLTPRHG